MHGMKRFRAALFIPRTRFRSFSWLLLLLLAVASAVHGPGVQVNAQGIGFISIDCGATHTISSDNISWTIDNTYTALGSNAEVKNSSLSSPYDTLRFFPDKSITKNCYVFNTTANLSYLIRAGFSYGNYDNLSDSQGLPSFDLLFEANLWSDVTFNSVSEVVIHEMIALSTRATSSVCVARSKTSSHDPFISSLEIRPLSTNQNVYSPVYDNFLMQTNSRINFGQTTNESVRYPDDEYDRIWRSDSEVIDGISTYSIISTNRTVSTSKDSPPTKVMQTARSPNTTENMGFSFTAKFGPGQYYLAFYFAEIVNSSSQRIMDMYIDNGLSIQGLNLFSLRGLYNTLEVYNSNYSITYDNYTLMLTRNSNSTSAPIINAAESYLLVRKAQGTDEQDVQALESIKSAFNISSIWTGDPCRPAVHKWSWLDCDNATSPARVIALNFSNMDLHSEVPLAIANLSALTSVDLHNNSLFGKVPASLGSLKNLTFLDLSNNNLSGEFPEDLIGYTNFSGNPLLCFNSSCDSSPTATTVPAPAPVSISHSDSSARLGLIVGLVLPSFFGLVVLVLVLHKRKSQKEKRQFVAHSAHWPPVPPFTEISKTVDPMLGEQKGASESVPIYSFADLQTATNNFKNKITAPGNFGTLFHGTLSDGQEVVVKLLKSKLQQSPTDFLYKVTPLSFVNHKNLLRPIGFCAEVHRLMFVYEHVQKGSLYDYLHEHFLDWKTRLSILLQVAQGLEHLHNACTPSIIHGNLKSTNVLLSGDGLLAKVSNFGIYGLSPDVDATSGYLDPAYFKMHKLTEKSDVYSFGVLILEVICGRRPFDTSLAKEAWNIVDWVYKVYYEGGHELIADTCLRNSYNAVAFSKVVQLALHATDSNVDERPTMAELVAELKEANKIVVGHHVAFVDLEARLVSHNSNDPLSSEYTNVLYENDASQEEKHT